jgi:hypothetical protein
MNTGLPVRVRLNDGLGMKAEELQNIFGTAIIGNAKKKRRQTPSSKRKEISDAQIAVLEKVAKAIRNKARETPAWARGYFSAVTTIEIELGVFMIYLSYWIDTQYMLAIWTLELPYAVSKV